MERDVAGDVVEARVQRFAWTLPAAPGGAALALLNVVANSPDPDSAFDALGWSILWWAAAVILGLLAAIGWGGFIDLMPDVARAQRQAKVHPHVAALLALMAAYLACWTFGAVALSSMHLRGQRLCAAASCRVASETASAGNPG